MYVSHDHEAFQGGALRTDSLYFEFEMERLYLQIRMWVMHVSLHYMFLNLKSYERGLTSGGINVLFGKAKICGRKLAIGINYDILHYQAGGIIIICLDSLRLFSLWDICL